MELKEKLSPEKREIFNAIEQSSLELNSVGHDIWKYRELGGQEHTSHNRIVTFLKKKGFKISERFKDFDTSFRAEYGESQTGGKVNLNIGYMCEYSADPETGHSHGHNLVTVVCLAAAIGLQRILRFSKNLPGMITVIGCTSNTDKSAKNRMMKAGFFHGIDFMLTAYPAPFTNLQPRFLAAKKLHVTFTGRKARDNEHPWEEANPVNAVVLTYQSVSAIRQHLQHEWQVKGIISKAGTDVCTLPQSATTEYQIKSPSERGLHVLNEKLYNCFEGAATSSGCKVDIRELGHTFITNVNCPMFEELYTVNAKRNGFTFYNIENEALDEDEIAVVSVKILTMKIFYFAGFSVKLGTDDFHRFCGSPDAEFMSILQGKSLAMMGYDLLTIDNVMTEMHETHRAKLAEVRQEVEDPM